MKFQGRARTPQQASTFSAQMDEQAKAVTDPIQAMTMRVASEMMAVMPRHASTARDVDTLLRAMPNICISIVETVAATAYQGDMEKARDATMTLLRTALASYERSRDARRIHVQSN